MFIAIQVGVTILVFLIVLARGIRTVPQAHVAVVTRFGKYARNLQPGLHIINPFTQKITVIIPVQNRTEQLQFAAITEDQAAVHFTATIIYTVSDMEEATIMQVAFKFINEQSFSVALNSAVEASVREFVSGKKQAEVLGLRQSIVDHAKATLDEQLASWGYLLVDLTVNDIAFDPDVMKSMSRVVAAKNAQTAAEFEGQALLIARTKQAEAEGRALVISAQNGAEASRLRGEGIAAQRSAIAAGLTESGILLAEAGMDVSMLAFSMWTEALRDIATHGTGNTIFLDGGMDSLESSMRRTQGFLAGSSMRSTDRPAKTAATPEQANGGNDPTVGADRAAALSSQAGDLKASTTQAMSPLDQAADVGDAILDGVDAVRRQLAGLQASSRDLPEQGPVSS